MTPKGLHIQANVVSGRGYERRREHTGAMLKGVLLLVCCEGVIETKVSFAILSMGGLDENFSMKSMTAAALCTCFLGLKGKQSI